MLQIQPQYFNTVNNNVSSVSRRVYEEVVQPVMQNVYPEAVNCAYQTLQLTSFYPQIYSADKLREQPQRISPSTNNPFMGITEEERNLPQKDRNKVLFEKGKLLELSRCGSDVNCEVAYTILKDDKNFNELLNSKFFSKKTDKAEGFVKLINIAESLRKQRENKLINDYYNFYETYLCTTLPSYSIYESSDIKDYVRHLNNFVKNEYLSDDLKEYYIETQADKLDEYYSRLDNLKNNKYDLKILTTKHPPVKYML